MGDGERRRLEELFESERASVESRLSNWAAWSWDQLPTRLGYPSSANFTPGTSGIRPTYDPDDAELVEWILSTMRMTSLLGLRNALLLRTQYVSSGMPEELRAKRHRTSRTTYQRRVRQAEFDFWMIARGLK